MYKLCRHIRTSGGRCRCAALPNQNFCHYHVTQRKFAATGNATNVPLELPPIEDHFSVQVAISRILSALATGAIDQRNAGLFLYGIQIAASNLPRETGVLTPSDSVRRVVLTGQNEQIAVAETVFEEDEEEDTEDHKKNCDCDKCVYYETDDPHHPNCGCCECHYFAEEAGNDEKESPSQASETTPAPSTDEDPASGAAPLSIQAKADERPQTCRHSKQYKIAGISTRYHPERSVAESKDPHEHASSLP